jgi:hypothetical protein
MSTEDNTQQIGELANLMEKQVELARHGYVAGLE